MATNKSMELDQRRLKGLKRANFQLIEQELFHYKRSREMFVNALRELDIIADSTVVSAPFDQDRVQTSSYLSDIVAHRATEYSQERLYTVMVLKETARRLDAIEWMMKRLAADPEPKKLELLEKRYFEGKLTDQGLQDELHISPVTLWRWRREAVQLVANRLGMIV